MITIYWAFKSWKGKRKRLFMSKPSSSSYQSRTFSLKYRFRSLSKSKERRRISAPVCLFLQALARCFSLFILFFQFKLSHCSFWAETLRFGLVGGVDSVHYRGKDYFSEGLNLYLFLCLESKNRLIQCVMQSLKQIGDSKRSWLELLVEYLIWWSVSIEAFNFGFCLVFD